MTQSIPLREQLEALESVQEIDLKIDTLTQRQSAIPEELKELERIYLLSKKAYDARTSEKEELEKTLRQAQAALDLNSDRTTRASERLEGVTNQSEYQAASKEVEQLKKSRGELEAQMATLQGQLDELNKACTELETKMQEAQSSHKAKEAEIKSKSDELEGELSRLMGEKKPFSEKVNPSLLSRYDRIRKARAGLGIVPAVAGQCKGCHMMLPPQQYNELQKGEELASCSSCMRILFVPSNGESDKE